MIKSLNIVIWVIYMKENESLTSKIFDFIGYHFIAICVGIPAICTAIIVGIIYLICWLLGIKISNENLNYIILIVLIVVTNTVSFVYAQQQISKTQESITKKSSSEIASLMDTIKLKELEINKINKYCNEINKKNDLINSNLEKSFEKIGEFIADIKTHDWKLSEKYLHAKKHPAHKKAQEVSELKQKTKEFIKEYKLMRYEYDMLFSLFPELENYLEYYSSEKVESLEDVKDNYDYVQNWISKSEYNSLEENERNQLALDRYIESRKKSKWAIGRDYEMFIGYEYEQQGYQVIYTGMTERLEDKGRDLIAKKGDETLIIQCKNWSKHKEIHENHICQLFGTTVQYNIENNTLFKAIPVFITSASLSETALKFAEYLGVRVIQNKKLEEFPRIKCNINNNEKIYHLPFDQQYDRTVIGDQKGEFYAWTVQEAVSNGFRRAKKYFYK